VAANWPAGRPLGAGSQPSARREEEVRKVEVEVGGGGIRRSDAPLGRRRWQQEGRKEGRKEEERAEGIIYFARKPATIGSLLAATVDWRTSNLCLVL